MANQQSSARSDISLKSLKVECVGDSKTWGWSTFLPGTVRLPSTIMSRLNSVSKVWNIFGNVNGPMYRVKLASVLAGQFDRTRGVKIITSQLFNHTSNIYKVPRNIYKTIENKFKDACNNESSTSDWVTAVLQYQNYFLGDVSRTNFYFEFIAPTMEITLTPISPLRLRDQEVFQRLQTTSQPKFGFLTIDSDGNICQIEKPSLSTLLIGIWTMNAKVKSIHTWASCLTFFYQSTYARKEIHSGVYLFTHINKERTNFFSLRFNNSNGQQLCSYGFSGSIEKKLSGSLSEKKRKFVMLKPFENSEQPAESSQSAEEKNLEEKASMVLNIKLAHKLSSINQKPETA